jgi:DNA ligase 1
MKPMLARTKGPRFDQLPCYVQPKLNGVRALYQDGIFQSRDEKIWKAPVVEHLVQQLMLHQDTLGRLILDGEFYVHGWRLQRINGAIAVNRNKPNDDTSIVQFHIFDVVDPYRKFSDRWFEIYHGLIRAELPNIKAVPTALANSQIEIDQHFYLYTREGYEGVMLRPNGVYEFGSHVGRNGNDTQFRSKFLWKYKQWEDDEFTCVGVTLGEGKADIGIGALRCAKEGGPAFKVGTGFTDEERVEFMRTPPVGKLVRVRYLCLTKDGIPFNPSFIAVM